MTATLRFGVLGLGMGGAAMLAAMARHPDIAVVAAADLHAAHRERFEADFAGRTYSDAEPLCASPDVDVVYIATPHQFHAGHVEMAAAHGKHVIVEKPMALTLAECDRMIAATERAGVTLVVGHTASFNPSVQRMRRLIISGEVGRLAMISATAYSNFLYRPRRPEELVTELGGGILFNQVPHQVDAARFIGGGMVRSVRATTWVLDPQRPTEGAYMALLDFEEGAAASLVYSGYDHFESADITAGRGVQAPERYGAGRRALHDLASAGQELALRLGTGLAGRTATLLGQEGGELLQGELGTFIVTCAGADLRLAPEGVAAYTTGGLRLLPPAPYRGAPGRGSVLDELYYAVTEDRPVVHSGRWGKATMEVCLAVQQSAQERREVELVHQVPTVDPEA